MRQLQCEIHFCVTFLDTVEEEQVLASSQWDLFKKQSEQRGLAAVEETKILLAN